MSVLMMAVLVLSCPTFGDDGTVFDVVGFAPACATDVAFARFAAACVSWVVACRAVSDQVAWLDYQRRMSEQTR